ncbi:hypothetical protein NM688_g2271 [Phlebia brevispora]|uniref:Uncharacterized protein n=1 Tax=Phlebia brevispora TaxID=194682 RepID=A0ACC1T948_9APHY|nr:hypothetical protein NM688_g2271 [Phlebia brevispora]
MDHSFEAEENSARPLYARSLTISECELSDHGSVTPSPSSLDSAISRGPTTPVMKDLPTTPITPSRSPVSTLAASITEGTPEWYLKKLQEKNLDTKQLVSLQTVLKGKDASWVNHFVELRGMSVLAHRLYQFSQKKGSRRREDVTTEQEVVKCITYILNHKCATDIALTYNAEIMVSRIASGLNTSQLPTRRFILDILVFLVYWKDGQACSLVISALEALSEDNGETGGCYAFWFKSLQAALSGKSQIGMANGQPQRRGSEAEATLTEYLMSNILLMNGIMEAIDDLDVRLHHRSLMASSGLQTIIKLARSLGIVTIDKQLALFEQTLADDADSLDERMSQDHSCNLVDLDDVYNALRTKAEGSKAKDHLLSILQHLLLIPDDKPDFVHRLQLVDTVVSDVVMDSKLGGGEKRLGFSVERMVSQMNQVERTQKLEEDLVKVRSNALELKLEKEDLEDRLERSEQMIMNLQTVIARLDCEVHDYTRVAAPKAAYDERIAQLAVGMQKEDSPAGTVGSPTDEKDSKQPPMPTSPPPTTPKLSFWGITSSWLGMRQAADGQPIPTLENHEKVEPDVAAVAISPHILPAWTSQQPTTLVHVRIPRYPDTLAFVLVYCSSSSVTSMDTFFGKKKNRPRQSSVSTNNELSERSVPYHKLGPPVRSPVAVTTVSQGIRGNPTTVISAPMTNPTLTASGTEMNKYAITKQRTDREHSYREASPFGRPGSPSTSISTADSSTLYTESETSAAKAYARRIRQSESGSSMTDFGMPSPTSPSGKHRTLNPDSAPPSSRPPSGFTSPSTPRFDDKRSSRYTSLSYETHHPHLSSISQHLYRHGNSEEFYFPRPENEEDIEALFDNICRTRELGEIPNLSIDKKWEMVYNDEQLRWKEEKQREEQAKRQMEAGHPAAIIEGTPEWYIKKFLDKTVTAKQASSLLVNLRGKEVSWFKHFIELQGTSVLAQALSHISRKAMQRRKEDTDLEYEIAKILKFILNRPFAVNDALAHNMIVTQMASALNTPQLQTRKLILDILVFLVYWKEEQAHSLVLNALNTLSDDNHEHGSPYTYWFKSFQQALIGRGRMGTFVGASEEVKRHGGHDPSLNDYTTSNFLLIRGILEGVEDLDLRVHHRAQMEAAGLQQIIRICRTFGVAGLEKQMNLLQQTLDDDEKRLKERMDQEILRDLANPEDVYTAIQLKTQESKARDYFLSMMQHLLLIREEGPALVHYFQLIDSMVTDLVMDKKLGGAEQRLGHSVERIIAQFNEADRYQHVEDELAKAHASILRLRLEKESLEEEISQGGEGLVGTLKAKVAQLESKLQVSRDNTTRLQQQMAAQKSGYEEQIEQLEAQIMELFRMLKEVGRGVDKIIETSGGMDRKTLIETLEKHMQRDKTISILEGRNKPQKRKANGQAAISEGESEDDEQTPTKPGGVRKHGKSSTKGRGKAGKAAGASDVPNGHTSQFMDADEAIVQEVIQQQFAKGVNVYPPRDGPSYSPRSIRGSPRRKNFSKSTLGEFSTPTSSADGLLAAPTDEFGEQSDHSGSGVEGDEQDDASQLSRSRSGRSGSSIATDVTSVTSKASGSRQPVPGSLAEELRRQLTLKGRPPSEPSPQQSPTLPTLTEETPDPFEHSPEDPFLPPSPELERSVQPSQSQIQSQDALSVQLEEHTDGEGEESQLFPGSDLF